MECISSSFFCRFIGVQTVITMSEIGVAIEVENSCLIKIQWQDLIVPPSFYLSFFGQIVTLRTAKKNYVFTMLAYNAKRLHKSNCERLWINANIKRVDTFLSTIKKITTSRYLRQSTVERMQIATNQELKRWFPWITSSKTHTIVADKLQLLSSYHHWQAPEIAECRENYINEQLQLHKVFFDNIESNPLTPCQRQACVIDNDNNLLLAGAGTGKTSVMVGRAGYLIASSQAKSDEILLLAYGRKAATEMDDRIQHRLTTDKIKASTFHSVGLSIIAQVEGKKPSLSILAENEKIKLNWIEACIKKLINEEIQYRELMLEYFSKFYYVERSGFDFTSLGDTYQYFNDNNIRTFKGEKVHNFGVLFIANELFSHGIEYQYKANYAYDVITSEYKRYKPDFFLPELDMYIDYYEIDNQGNLASYIDKIALDKSIKHKRDTHRTFATQCLELTYAQHQNGKLLSTLRASLVERQVQLNQALAKRLPTELILETLNENGKVTTLVKIFGQLIGLYKTAYLNGTLADKVSENTENGKQMEKALALLQPIFIAYQQQLSIHSEIDFEDMINKAVNYVETGKFQSPWRYIMVDEFQDISEPRARLVKALRDSIKECSIFAVGDDWQAIYRFSGADVTLTTQFEAYFGDTVQSELDLTFRFNNHIGKVATDFISKNPAQIYKTIKSLKQVKAPAISLLKRDTAQPGSDKTTLIDEIANGAIDDILAAISSMRSSTLDKPATVYLLARFSFLLPKATELKRLSNQYPLLSIEAQTFHASKGKEADFVIILGLKKGAHGFPSEKATPYVIDALLAKKEDFNYAEERRLFYVALTRAKDRVYIIADMAESNLFVKELMNEHHIELNEFESTINQSITKELHCSACETGILNKQTSRFGSFYACSHFPRCEYKEKPCDKCGSAMTRERYSGFKACSNDDCKSLIPTCGICNAEMVLRSSKKGEFWGCKNYKGNDAISCKNSIDNAKVNWPETI